MTKKNEQDALERYLLGEVSDDERSEIEQSYFADDAVFDQLIDVQNDLVDSYVRGTLPAADRKRFEERFLTTGSGVDRVEFARALKEKIAARSSRKTGRVRLLAIAASVVIVVIVAAWMTFTLQRRTQPPIANSPPKAPQQQRTTSPTPVQAQTQTAPLQSRPPASALITTVLLTPGGTRESDAATPLVLRPAPQFVRVELVLEDDRYDSYAAELQDVEGRVLWKAHSLRATTAPSGRMVAVSVPAKLLPPGDYIVVLQGIDRGEASEINNYTFTVMALPARR
jgi:hypothetical protein